MKLKIKPLSNPISKIVKVLIYVAAVITVAMLLVIVGYILIRGVPNLTPSLFQWKYTTKNVSMLPAIINTVEITVLTLLIAVPLGVFAAIYLVEYSRQSSLIVKLIRVTTETLTGIPSIVYGLFGYFAFVLALGMEPIQIRIADFIARAPDKVKKGIFREKSGFFGRKKENKVIETPKSQEIKIAFVDGDNIFIEPLSKDILNEINL